MEPKTGWVILIDTLCQGPTLAYKLEIDGKMFPQVFESHEEAYKEIASDQIAILQQFIDGDRDLEDVDWSPEEFVANFDMDENGEFVVSDDEGNPLIEDTLENWRKNL